MRKSKETVFTYEGFIIKECPCACYRYDLYRMMTVQEGKNTGQEYEGGIAFGITLAKAVEMISETVATEKAADLQSFLKEYREISKYIVEQIKS